MSDPADTLVSELNPTPPSSGSPLLIVVTVVVLLAGSVVGFVLGRNSASSSQDSTPSPTQKHVKTANEVGTTDTKTFSDTAKGKLESGGMSGEGTHRLIRPGGDSQTVYLISSIVDLDEFVGKVVEVFGQTIDAQRVGWLMDVGRVKLAQ